MFLLPSAYVRVKRLEKTFGKLRRLAKLEFRHGTWLEKQASGVAEQHEHLEKVFWNSIR